MKNLGLLVAAIACGCGSSHGNKTADAPSGQDSKMFQDAPGFMDAPSSGFDFSCTGNPAPTTAAANVTISGTVTEVSLNGTTPAINPLQGATVVACKGNCAGPNKLATSTSDASGNFSDGPFATGGTPLAGYFRMTHTGDRTIYEYPAVPVTADATGVPILTFTPTIIQALALVPGGCTQNDATKGMLAVLTTDCQDQRITDSANVTLTIKQGGTVVSGTTVIDLGALSPMAAGVFLVCNVPAGVTNVAAKYMSTTLLAHDVNVTAATTTSTEIRPGY
jgi:hypothetical protein